MERPNWGHNQVRSLRGIKVGRFYFEINTVQKISGVLWKITGTPDKKNFVSNRRFFSENDSYSSKNSLSDRSVIPYSSGYWNPSNFLLRTRAKTVKGALRSMKKTVAKLREQYN